MDMSSENNTNEAMNRDSINEEQDTFDQAASAGTQPESDAAGNGEYHFSANDQSSPLYSHPVRHPA